MEAGAALKPTVTLAVVLLIGIAAFAVIFIVTGPRGHTGSSTHSTGTIPAGELMGAPDSVSLPGTPAAGASFKGLNYCNDGANGGQQTLDLYYPTARFGPSVPIVIWVHGGGWHLGDDTGIFSWFLDGMLRNGIAVASINYRLAPDYMFPAQVYDAQCAVAFVRQGATQLGVNPEKIGIAGASAGAQVASWVGAKSNSSSPYRVMAVGLVSAPENVSAVYPSDAAWTTAVSDDFGSSASLKYQGSPVNFATASAPPYLIEHGYNDTIVPYEQAVQMYNALKHAGASAELILVNNAGHGLVPVGGFTPDPSLSVVQQDMISFFIAKLG